MLRYTMKKMCLSGDDETHGWDMHNLPRKLVSANNVRISRAKSTMLDQSQSHVF